MDWIVQGSTYAKYNVAVAANTAGANVAISACAWTDIDGDAVLSGDAWWMPQISAAGAVVTAPPNAPCVALVDLTAHTGGLVYAHGVDSMGRPVQMSADSIF